MKRGAYGVVGARSPERASSSSECPVVSVTVRRYGHYPPLRTPHNTGPSVSTRELNTPARAFLPAAAGTMSRSGSSNHASVGALALLWMLAMFGVESSPSQTKVRCEVAFVLAGCKLRAHPSLDSLSPRTPLLRHINACIPVTGADGAESSSHNWLLSNLHTPACSLLPCTDGRVV